QLTRHVAVVQYPILDRASVRHLELIKLSDTRLMLVLITDTGRVEQRQVDLPGLVDENTVAELRTRLNMRVAGKPMRDVPNEPGELAAAEPPATRGVTSAVVAALLAALVDRREERVVVGGASNLTRLSLDFP